MGRILEVRIASIALVLMRPRAIKKEFRVIDQRDLSSLRFIVDENFRGAITKASFVRFLLWFWPILPDEARL